MQCSCGASADLTTQTNRKCKAELRYYQCEKCKRVSDGVLTIQGRDVSWDHDNDAQARRWFDTLTPESAESLYNSVTALQDVFLEDDQREKGEASADGDIHKQASFSF